MGCSSINALMKLDKSLPSSALEAEEEKAKTSEAMTRAKAFLDELPRTFIRKNLEFMWDYGFKLTLEKKVIPVEGFEDRFDEWYKNNPYEVYSRPNAPKKDPGSST